ncbi:MAG TPA: DNA-directed RNA polymerase subunit K [Nitrosarchaeum sp.]|nr:DNA-directed RNA polymerase subunit K [Nitrosarchaeum sp.]
MSDVNEQELVVDEDSEEQIPEVEAVEEEVSEVDEEPNLGLTKAMDNYRKINEAKDLTEKEQAELEKRLKEIEAREIIETDPIHEPKEFPSEKGKIMIGPPTLTRFEKARIMGARALQLSLGAPPFITIPQTARTSLDIAMEELEKRVIPIVIRRVLPNGDYQNIPIDYFK